MTELPVTGQLLRIGRLVSVGTMLAAAFAAVAPLEVMFFSKDNQALFVEVEILRLQSAYGLEFIFFRSFQFPSVGLL